MSAEIQQHLEDSRRHLTNQRIDKLSHAIGALANSVAVWKAHEQALGVQSDRKQAGSPDGFQQQDQPDR